MLASWSNYEAFVLEFLEVPKHFQAEILQEVEQLRGTQKEEADFEDPNSLFFNVSIWKVVKVRDHYEFFLSISTHDGRFRKQINKRFNVVR